MSRLLPTGRKIFCIGFNKTGTDSLHHFFLKCGFRSKHGHGWTRMSRTKFGKLYIHLAADCYSDGEAAEFRNLQDWFPRSVFVLNDREERPWLRSRVKHVLRAGVLDADTAVRTEGYRGMSEDYFANPEEAVERWLLERRFYYRKVYRWFRGAENFLELRVTEDPNWRTVLAEFLRHHGYAVPAAVEAEAIHANRRADAAVPAPEALQDGYDIIDRCLARRPQEPAEAVSA